MLIAPSSLESPWWWREDSQDLTWGFTSRRGGFSSGVHQGLNLALHVGDDAAVVAQNRSWLAADLNLPVDRVRYMDQVHGCDVATISADSLAGQIPSVDGAVTADRGVALVVMVADCVPVVLADIHAGVIGVAHAGRPGMVAGVVPATIAAMRDLGATKIAARVGPSISARQYEVEASLRDAVAEVEPLAASVTGWGTPAVDVAAGVLSQLARCGVDTQTVAGCSASSSDLYSYRRDGQTGRFAGVVMLPETQR